MTALLPSISELHQSPYVTAGHPRTRAAGDSDPFTGSRWSAYLKLRLETITLQLQSLLDVQACTVSVCVVSETICSCWRLNGQHCFLQSNQIVHDVASWHGDRPGL